VCVCVCVCVCVQGSVVAGAVQLCIKGLAAVCYAADAHSAIRRPSYPHCAYAKAQLALHHRISAHTHIYI
jgi:hypothetical protein